MAKLKAIPSRLTVIKPRLQRADASGHDPVEHKFRPYYKTQRWRDLRFAIIRRDRFTCQMCGKVDDTKTTKGMTADHIKPHRHRDEALFWDAGNLMCLCNSCHSSTKQRIENAERLGYK